MPAEPQEEVQNGTPRFPPPLEALDPGEHPPLSESYQKAKKNYTLCSGLLLAWELVGIDIPTAPLDSIKVTLVNPGAAPLVLLTLMVFFAFRTTVEWFQNSLQRRRFAASQLDFAVAHLIAVGGIALYAYNQLLGQLVLGETAWWVWPFALICLMAGGFATFSLAVAVDDLFSGFREKWSDKLPFHIVSSTIAWAILLVSVALSYYEVAIVPAISAVGGAALTGFRWWQSSSIYRRTGYKPKPRRRDEFS